MGIGKKIKQLRKQAGLSQQEVAQKLDMARATYAGLEIDKREPDLGELKAISQFYEIPMMELIAEEGDDWPGVLSEPTPVYRAASPDHDTPAYHPTCNPDKLREVLLYVLARVGAEPTMGESTLYKLLYLIDFDYYEQRAASLTGLTYLRTQYGPLPTKSFDELVAHMQTQGELEVVATKHFKNTQRKYLPAVAPKLCELSAQELKYLDHELTRYGTLSSEQLFEQIQRDPPWRICREGDALPYHAAAYRKNSGVY